MGKQTHHPGGLLSDAEIKQGGILIDRDTVSTGNTLISFCDFSRFAMFSPPRQRFSVRWVAVGRDKVLIGKHLHIGL
jgi:hypothetical protein